MRILMTTNTYHPHGGGVARSVQSFSNALTPGNRQRPRQ